MKLTNSGVVASDADKQRLQTQLRNGGVKLKGGVPPEAFGDPAKDLDEPATAAAATDEQLSALEALLAARRGELVNLPILGAAWLQLVPHAIMNEIESELIMEMARLNIPAIALFTDTTWELERKARMMAAAARKPDDPTHQAPLLPKDFWLGKAGPNKDKGVDDDLVVACFEVYRDMRARLDPIGIGSLTPEDRELILDAVKKKDGTTLVTFGAVRLTLWLLTTDVLPSSSPTPVSSVGT